MKKILSVVLLAAMALTLGACGKTEAKPQGADLSGESLSAIVDKIYEQKAPQFPTGPMEVDLSDAESVLWLTGISDPALLKEALVSEAMMGSQAYSLVLVRVNDAAKAEEVANTMLENIDPAKWICVQADDMVLFVMIDSQFGLPAADLIGAFKTVCGGVLDKELSK